MLWEDNYLAHYGIKGQQWGVRRFQNPDGTLTAEGRAHYDVGDIKSLKQEYKIDDKIDKRFKDIIDKEKAEGKEISDRRKQLIKDYLEKGYTQENAEVQALRRENAEKFIKIAGAVALTAALAYGAYKGHQWLKEKGNVVIKQGTAIQRIQIDPNEDLGRNLYVSPDKKDWDKYKNMYGSQIVAAGRTHKPQKLIAETNKKLKIAGERAGKKTFDELMKEDAEFKKDYENYKQNFIQVNRRNGRTLTEYEKFNRALVNHNNVGNRLQEKFYNALKKKGFNGVIDVNDRHFSGYEAKNPTILFNLKDHITNKRVSEVELDEIRKELPETQKRLARQVQRRFAKEEVFKLSKRLAAYSAALSVGTKATLSTQEKDYASKQAKYRVIINAYKKEHPKTKLSDDEILKNELGKA